MRRNNMTNTKWTYEKLAEEARKYETKQEFRAKNSSAYAAAKYRRIIDKVCSHMIPAHVSWTGSQGWGAFPYGSGHGLCS